MKAQKGFDEKSKPELLAFAGRVGQVVARLREADGLSQNAVAERIGLSSAEISRLLRAHHDPGIADAIDLAGKLGVSVGWLLAGDGTESGAASPVDAAGQARAAATALGFPNHAIELGLAESTRIEETDPWEILLLIRSASRAPAAPRPTVATKVRPYAANEDAGPPTVVARPPTPATPPPVEAPAAAKPRKAAK